MRNGMNRLAVPGILAVTLLLGCLMKEESSSGSDPKIKPDTSKVDTTKPDTTKPDTTRPDTTKPDTIKADTTKADTALPVVTGLKATYDTVTGVATLIWRKAPGTRVDAYLVYRNEDSPTAPALSVLIGHTRDTVFTDTVRRSPGEDIKVLYRLRTKDSREEVGPASDPLRLHVVPLGMVRTTMTYVPVGLREGRASIKDTIRLVLQFHNPTRKNKQIRWNVGGPTPKERIAALDGLRGADTLVLVPDQPHSASVKVSVTDEAGSVWTLPADSAFEVVLDRPTISYEVGERFGGTLFLNFGEPFDFKPRFTDKFGAVVKQEWDIGATGTFVEVPFGTSPMGTTPYRYDVIPCVVRATDDDGLTAVDTVYLDVVPTAVRLKDPNWGFKTINEMHGIGGKLYIVRDGFDNRVYDPATRQVSKGPYLDTRGPQIATLSIGDRIYAMGAVKDSGLSLVEFRAGNGQWSSRATLPGFKTAAYVQAGGDLFAVPNHPVNTEWLSARLFRYRPIGDSWEEIVVPAMLDSASIPSFASFGKLEWVKELDGEVYLYRYYESKGELAILNPGNGTWKVRPVPAASRPASNPLLFNGPMDPAHKLWVLYRDGLYFYDPAADKWWVNKGLALGSIVRHWEIQTSEALYSLQPPSIYKYSFNSGKTVPLAPLKVPSLGTPAGEFRVVASDTSFHILAVNLGNAHGEYLLEYLFERP